MGLITKIIGGILLLAIVAVFLEDPNRFIAALGFLWNGIIMIGHGLLWICENLPEWLARVK